MTRRTAVLATVAAAGALGLWVAFGEQTSAQGQAPGKPEPGQSSVTKEQFEQWMTKLSNWGRWGKDDERGALNLITAEKTRQAGTLVKTGASVSLARQVARKPPRARRSRGPSIKAAPSRVTS